MPLISICKMKEFLNGCVDSILNKIFKMFDSLMGK